MRFTRQEINRARYAGEADYDPEGVFVDVYSMEYNRAIEPMRGGYGDSFYYQMWQNIRRFKGVRPLPPASAPVPDDWAAYRWDDVGPAYADDGGDTFARSHFGYGGSGTLTDATGRNDIRLCKVARSRSTLWFMAEAARPLTRPPDDAWMTLYVGADAAGGLRFRVRPQPDGRSARLEERVAAAWEARASAPCRIDGRRVVVALPRPALGLQAGAPVRLRFKWSDNVRGEDPLAGWTDGDTAPNGRAAYRYHGP
jgi:hypothetical protein